MDTELAGAERDAMRLTGVLALRDGPAPRCTIDRAIQVVGVRSAMLLMREAYYGTRRFDDFARRVGISDAVAAARLRELTDAGLLVKAPYREDGQRTRYEYRLTDMGRDLLPAVVALMEWGDRYLSDPDGPPVALRHAGCGAPVHAKIVCDEGHEVSLGEIDARRRPPRKQHRS